MRLRPLILSVSIIIFLVLLTSCSLKQDNLAYPLMSLEYNQEYLEPVVRIDRLGISFQPVKGSVPLPEENLSQVTAMLDSSSQLELISAYLVPDENIITIVAQMPAVSSEDYSTGIDAYFQLQAAQYDTLVSVGKFTHNDVLFDQAIYQKNDLIFVQLIGRTKQDRIRFSINYFCMAQDFSEIIKRVEASISSISINRS
ncbi:MAG: hypothetical protein R6V77_05920 [Candidatus Cloacimonadaceae bacterium]